MFQYTLYSIFLFDRRASAIKLCRNSYTTQTTRRINNLIGVNLVISFSDKVNFFFSFFNFVFPDVCVGENTPAYKIHVSEEIWTSQRATSGIQIFQNAPLGGLVTAIQNQRSGNSN